MERFGAYSASKCSIHRERIRMRHRNVANKLLIRHARHQKSKNRYRLYEIILYIISPIVWGLICKMDVDDSFYTGFILMFIFSGLAGYILAHERDWLVWCIGTISASLIPYWLTLIPHSQELTNTILRLGFDSWLYVLFWSVLFSLITAYLVHDKLDN